MHRWRARNFLSVAALALLAATPRAAGEDRGIRVIETKPLKLIGDGAAAVPAPPARPVITIATPPLRLVGDGAAPRVPAPPAAIAIETRPLKLIGAKP